MVNLQEDIQGTLPFISVIRYGIAEYIGIIINQDSSVTSFYDLGAVHSAEARRYLVELGEVWWWESNRKIPISIFLRTEISPFSHVIKTFHTRDTTIISGPIVNLLNMTAKRVKRKSVTLLRKPKPE